MGSSERRGDKIDGDQLEKPYHARGMSWLAGTVQRPVTVYGLHLFYNHHLITIS
jgi:hypothetical protein